MKKKRKQGLTAFDEAFDRGEATVDFRHGVLTQGLSQVIKLPPLTIPAWLAVEIEQLSKTQANSKASIVRQPLSKPSKPAAIGRHSSLLTTP